MKTAKLIVSNARGLHSRPSAGIVELLDLYDVECFFISGNQRVNAKSLMDILSLAASYGTVLTVELSGGDSEPAFVALKQLFEDNFGEEE
jgi:phosphocarrier protein HPr